MLSRDQEVEEFKQHLEKVYRGDDFQDIVKTAECPDPFSADELQSAFSQYSGLQGYATAYGAGSCLACSSKRTCSIGGT